MFFSGNSLLPEAASDQPSSNGFQKIDNRYLGSNIIFFMDHVMPDKIAEMKIGNFCKRTGGAIGNTQYPCIMTLEAFCHLNYLLCFAGF